jgi:hypothetical protein
LDRRAGDNLFLTIPPADDRKVHWVIGGSNAALLAAGSPENEAG